MNMARLSVNHFRVFHGVCAGLLAVVLFSPKPAEAVILPPRCQKSKVLPANGTMVPANLGRIGFFAGVPPSDDGGIYEYSPTLVLQDEKGTPIQIEPIQNQYGGLELWENSYGSWRVKAAFLPNTTYTIAHSNPCIEPWDAGVFASEILQSTFQTGPAAPWPNILGTLSTKPAIREIVTLWASDYSVSFDGVYVDVVLTPDATLKPYQTLTYFEAFTIDGQPISHGEVPSIVDITYKTDGSPIFRVVVSCEPEERWPIHPRLPEGMHELAIVGKIFGMETALPSAKVKFNLSCAWAKRGNACYANSPGCDSDGKRIATGGGCQLGTTPGRRFGFGYIVLLAAVLFFSRRLFCPTSERRSAPP
jgi:hypothetical protein